jgi:hypothetical protein
LRVTYEPDTEIAMSDTLTHDEVIALAVAGGCSASELSYRGPGRTEGNEDRELAIALDWLVTDGWEDEINGSVDEGGHFARVAQYIIQTDSAGFVTVTDCKDLNFARATFEQLQVDYEKWYDDFDEEE